MSKKNYILPKAKRFDLKIYNLNLMTLILLASGLMIWALIVFLSLPNVKWWIKFLIILFFIPFWILLIYDNPNLGCRNIIFLYRKLKHFLKDNSSVQKIKDPNFWNPYDQVVNETTIKTKTVYSSDFKLSSGVKYVRAFKIECKNVFSLAAEQQEYFLEDFKQIFDRINFNFSILKLLEKNEYLTIIQNYEKTFEQEQPKLDSARKKHFLALIQAIKDRNSLINSDFVNSYYVFVYGNNQTQLDSHYQFLSQKFSQAHLNPTGLSAFELVNKLKQVNEPQTKISKLAFEQNKTNLDNLLAAQELKVYKSKIKFNHLYLNYSTVNTYPNFVQDLWFSGFVDNEATVWFHFQAIEKEEQRKLINNTLSRLKISKIDEIKFSDRTQYEQKIAILENIAHDVLLGQQNIFKTQIILINYGVN